MEDQDVDVQLEVAKERIALQAMGCLPPEDGAWGKARHQPLVWLERREWQAVCSRLRAAGMDKVAASIERQCGVAPL